MEKSLNRLKLFKAKDVSKAREGRGKKEESQVRSPNGPPRPKLDMRRRQIKSVNRKPGVAWSPNVPFIFKH